MGLTDSIKGSFLKSSLKTLTNEDSGSTIPRGITTLLLASNLNFSLIIQGFKTEETAIECGKVIGLILLATWPYFIGKSRKKEN